MRYHLFNSRGLAWLAFVSASVAWLGGCAVGPNYNRPAILPPAAFRDDPGAANNSFADLSWWQVYRDTMLQALVREALTNNYDLRIAATRVEQARAVAMQARSQFVPSLNYGGAVARGRNDLFGSAYPNNTAVASSAVATLNAFWEVDLWGRVRRLNESARAQFLARQEAQRGVRLSLLSDVATAYFQLQELDQELEIASRTTNSFGDSLKIFTRRVQGGTASDLESARAEAALHDAMSAIPFILEKISIQENELSILLGRNPGPIERQPFGTGDMLPPEVPAGLPSTLLERRPDLREAEQLLRSVNAQVGGAVAEFFPKIGLTALLGKISPELSSFTLGGANVWGIGAEATGPLFQGGKLVGQYRQTRAAHDEARLQYRQAALNALRDVSDALVLRQRLEEILEQQSRQVDALARSVKLSSERYNAGKASYYEILEAQQQLFPAQLNLARTKREQLLAVVGLYKALGGGWNEVSLLRK
ncbi:MAG: efflux system, outer rane lipoprotein NodT family [Verrucomicrobiales bacterium]|nr:efflux system, outer rane lipoprotein NodT family [Verrucomicrobiales bacterium]